VRQLETAMTRLQGDLEFRLGRLEGIGAPTAAAGSDQLQATPPPAGIAGTRPGQMLPPVGTSRVPTAPAVAAPAPAPVAEAAAPQIGVPKGATAVIAWQAAYAKALARDWPATQAQMTGYLANWPQSTRIPQAQYWLGRSFAERNQHAQAADAYLKVYNNHPRSDRAPDALIGLAGALLGIKNPQQGCRVLGELDSVYGIALTSTQQAEAKLLRTRARCAA
jgi:TolA-binding protein